MRLNNKDLNASVKGRSGIRSFLIVGMASLLPFATLAGCSDSDDEPGGQAGDSGSGASSNGTGASSGTGASGNGEGNSGNTDENPDCEDVIREGTEAVYLRGASAVRPLVKQIQATLADEVTFIYNGSASCNGSNELLNEPDSKLTGTADYWDEEGNRKSCNLPLAGVSTDIAVADVDAATCGEHLEGDYEITAKYKQLFGVYQAMTIGTFKDSTEGEVTADELKAIFGEGAKGENTVEPWSVPEHIFHRPSNSGTQIMISGQIGLKSTAWQGVEKSSSGDLSKALEAVSESSSIGILAADYIQNTADTNLKVLAFQGEGQTAAYLPDSSAAKFDKLNVRVGAYKIHAPVEFLVEVDGSGNYVPRQPGGDNKAAALKKAVDYLTLASSLDADELKSLIAAAAKAATVPACAMYVVDGAEHDNQVPCHGFFEKSAAGATDATECSADADCGTGEICSFGYCETTGKVTAPAPAPFN